MLPPPSQCCPAGVGLNPFASYSGRQLFAAMWAAWRRIVSESAAANAWFQIPRDIKADAFIVEIGNSARSGKQGRNQGRAAAFVAIPVRSIVEAIVNEPIRESI